MTILTAIGLTAPPLSTPIPNYGPACLIFNFFFIYVGLAPRHLKQYYGIDHNVSPRDDLNTYGEAAVREGKLTRAQLAMMRRNEAAQANSIENYILIVAGITAATYAGVPRTTINAAGLIYTIARVVYGITYILVDRPVPSLVRSAAWWVGNISCLTLLWKAGGLLNEV